MYRVDDGSMNTNSHGDDAVPAADRAAPAIGTTGTFTSAFTVTGGATGSTAAGGKSVV